MLHIFKKTFLKAVFLCQILLEGKVQRNIFMNIPRTSFPRVVIIGGGFAGISLAKQLGKQEIQAVLIDRHNYHTFQPF